MPYLWFCWLARTILAGNIRPHRAVFSEFSVFGVRPHCSYVVLVQEENWTLKVVWYQSGQFVIGFVSVFLVDIALFHNLFQLIPVGTRALWPVLSSSEMIWRFSCGLHSMSIGRDVWYCSFGNIRQFIFIRLWLPTVMFFGITLKFNQIITKYILLKLGTSWDDSTIAGNILGAHFPEYLSVTYLCVGGCKGMYANLLSFQIVFQYL